MIRNNQPISSKDFSKGLITRDDMLSTNFDQSPNMSDIKWYFDGSIGKRFGSSTTNSVVITSGGNATWLQNSSGTLSTNLTHYWNLDEASGTRQDQFGTLHLAQTGGPGSITGIRNQAVFLVGSFQSIYNSSASSFWIGNNPTTFAFWLYMVSTSGSARDAILVKGNGDTNSNDDYGVYFNGNAGTNKFVFIVQSGGSLTSTSVTANSLGVAALNTWYHIVAWYDTAGTGNIGISVNLSVNSSLNIGYSSTNTNNSPFVLYGVGETDGRIVPNPTLNANRGEGRLDELGMWRRVLTAQERSDLYGGGTGNTYDSGVTSAKSSWASFDFGASNLRWLTVAMGSGLLASSNRGTTWVTIASSRTSTYQSFGRSKNVLIATSDAYDVPLYWAGSAGTFAIALAVGSAPQTKYSQNYNGFLILLNSNTNKLGFYYADENLQLTDTWTNSFNIPSSLDDEITGSFILNKFLYVHTRYTIYLVQFVGGNPDWSYLKIRDFGYVPRTVKITYLKGQQVATGLDWDNRVRIFDGSLDTIISDPVENNNGYCDFATSKISHAGSGLLLSYAEYDTESQEYRLGLAIGPGSTQATTHLVLNTRTMAFYPYSNQVFNTMVMAQSNNQRALMAFDNSGYCHILNSGNLDGGATPINEVYDSPLIFRNTPTMVSKAHEIDLFFKKNSSGFIQYQDRTDLSNVFSKQNPLIELTNTEPTILSRRTEDVSSVQNTYQFRLTSSGNTTNSANPWKLVRVDYLQQDLGLGKGGL